MSFLLKDIFPQISDDFFCCSIVMHHPIILFIGLNEVATELFLHFF